MEEAKTSSRGTKMAKLRSDSPTCRRIVRAFLDFLDCVELAPGADCEAVDVVKDCLQDVFKLGSSSMDERSQPGLLLDLFASAEAGGQHKSGGNFDSASTVNISEPNLNSREIEDSRVVESEDSAHGLGLSKDELLGRFYDALDKINFFTSSPGGVEDPDRIAKATTIFDDAVKEMSNCKMEISLTNLAEILKSKGNEAVRLEQYSEAVELYTCAITISKKAVYYCNRAAAYINLNKYIEAIEDCLKSIEIDPNYSKAYSRLGSAYFAQGNYRDALDKGYLKALQLDPTNSTVKENIQMTEKRLREQHHYGESDQNRRSSDGEESSTRFPGSANNSFPFASFPMDASSPDFMANILRNMASSQSQNFASQSSRSTSNNTNFSTFPINASIPPELANIFGNIASATQGHMTDQMRPNGNAGELNEPEVRVDANINLNFGEGSEQVPDVLRSVMGMFTSQFTPQGGMPQGPDQADGNHH